MSGLFLGWLTGIWIQSQSSHSDPELDRQPDGLAAGVERWSPTRLAAAPSQGTAASTSALATDEESADVLVAGSYEDRFLNLERQRENLRSRHLVPLALSCAGEILSTRGEGVPLEPGFPWEPTQFDWENERSIIHCDSGGTWLLVAQRQEFPELFELSEASLAGRDSEAARISEDTWSKLHALARRADVARKP